MIASHGKSKTQSGRKTCSAFFIYWVGCSVPFLKFRKLDPEGNIPWRSHAVKLHKIRAFFCAYIQNSPLAEILVTDACTDRQKLTFQTLGHILFAVPDIVPCILDKPFRKRLGVFKQLRVDIQYKAGGVSRRTVVISSLGT